MRRSDGHTTEYVAGVSQGRGDGGDEPPDEKIDSVGVEELLDEHGCSRRHTAKPPQAERFKIRKPGAPLAAHCRRRAMQGGGKQPGRVERQAAR